MGVNFTPSGNFNGFSPDDFNIYYFRLSLRLQFLP